jgi:hypothetical protein
MNKFTGRVSEKLKKNSLSPHKNASHPPCIHCLPQTHHPQKMPSANYFHKILHPKNPASPLTLAGILKYGKIIL